MGGRWRSLSSSSKIKNLDIININNKEYKNALFIHIPKTSGTSIVKALDNSTLFDWKKDKIHKHYSYATAKEIEFIPSDTFKFSIVRNPFTRTFSYFKHFNKYNNVNFSMNDFLNVVEGSKFYEETPLIKYTQSYYLYLDGKNEMDKTYRFENLQEFEQDFGKKLTTENVGIYSTIEYNNTYTNKIINRVLDIYEEDFINFGYSQNFERK